MARRQSTSTEQQPILTRKHVTRAEREARQRQQVVVATAVVTALVALVLLGGFLYGTLVEPGQAIARVGDDVITRRDFYQRVNYERYRLFRTVQETREQAEEGLSDPSTGALFYQFYQQQLSQFLNFYSGIGSNTLEQMIREQVILDEADARGVTVSDEEIDAEIRRQLAQYEGAQIAEDVTATAVAQDEATATAEAFTPTPRPSPTPTLNATEEAEGGGELTDSEVLTDSEELGPTPTLAPTFTPAPTATPNIFTAEQFEADYQQFLADLRRYADYGEAEFREIIRRQLLAEKLQEDFAAGAEVSDTEEQVHVAHILVETEEEAQAVLARLDAGEEFAALAQELSTDQGSALAGGDLDWISRDTVVEPFAEAAFALSEPGEISEPVESQFGWHVIQLIEGPEERARDEAAIEQERNQAFSDFLTSATSAEGVERLWDYESLPADPFERQLEEAVTLPTPVPPPTSTPTPVGTPEAAPEEGEATPVP